ncbi:hypothetical protein, partial [Alkalibacillus haloalkaliphilus]|uniref:hypothetical protein n=1 Tax=Alkalibacillus haloalkaliphilus TaxID=94136 RepID=UPI002935FA8E
MPPYCEGTQEAYFDWYLEIQAQHNISFLTEYGLPTPEHGVRVARTVQLQERMDGNNEGYRG